MRRKRKREWKDALLVSLFIQCVYERDRKKGLLWLAHSLTLIVDDVDVGLSFDSKRLWNSPTNLEKQKQKQKTMGAQYGGMWAIDGATKTKRYSITFQRHKGQKVTKATNDNNKRNRAWQSYYHDNNEMIQGCKVCVCMCACASIRGTYGA